jgi:prolyl-tRNA editing enzyme YbaK/EbsC (Cys-tRNA(Pro) deacylase)
MYHSLVYKIISLLKENNYWFEIYEHKPVRTSEEAAQIRTGYTLQQGAKAIILRVKKAKIKEFVMLVIPGNCKFNPTKVKKILDSNDIRFATQEEISQLTNGVEIGGIPALGNLFGLKVYVEPKLLTNEKIIFNAGDRRFSVAINSIDYQKFAKPIIVNII